MATNRNHLPILALPSKHVVYNWTMLVQIQLGRPDSKKGDVMKVLAKLNYPKYGYDIDIENVKILDDSIYYEVEYVYIGQSSTSFSLVGIDGSFNSVQFGFFDENKEPINIFGMKEFNSYLGNSYGNS